MSTDQNLDLDALIGQVLRDQGPLIDQLLAHLAEYFAPDGAAPASLTSANDLVATIARNWSTPAASGAAEPIAEVAEQRRSCSHDSVVDRNLLLAAAVGACDCWGDDPDCPICGGEGTSAWMAPDRHLFAEYIYPAVRSLSVARASARRRHLTPDEIRRG
ncbi:MULTISPECIES: hypothetical protein [Streptomyces]|uniref:hypothetical protein n=1 Tax=Streptomyces TaxID=1883 RepID=UPI00115F798A|nr:hypothetical protein [Streptomyces melanosporofaciens]